MKKAKVQEAVNNYTSETAAALSEIWNSLNNGQQNKLLKNEKIRELLVHYGIING